jgi:hypothetical protein
MRRRTLLSVCAGIIGVAGCTAQPSPSDESTPSSADSATPTSPPADSATPTSSPIPTESVTSYQSLSAEGKEFFTTLRENGPVERAIDLIPSTIWDADYIRYSGATYAIEKTDTGRFIAEYTIRTGHQSKPQSATTNVVLFSELSEDAQAVFTEARTDGPYTTRTTTPPAAIREEPTIKYDGAYYPVSASHADLRVWRLSTTRS